MRTSNIFFAIWALVLLVPLSANGFSFPIGVSNTRIAAKKDFTRTYRYDKRTIARTQGSKSTIEINKADFEQHMKIGNKRALYIANNNDGTIPLNVGIIDIEGVQAQNWIVPNFALYDTDTFGIDHISVESTGYNGYYEAVNHAVHYVGTKEYEFFAIDNFELFSYGYTETDSATEEQEMIDYYLALSPIPLKIGEAYTGYVLFTYSDDPEYDSTLYQQDYDVVGYGTLTLPDGSTTEALKMHFTESYTDYKEDEVVGEGSYSEIVWYSKDGYYLRVGVDGDIWGLEGKIEATYVEYQFLKKDEVTGLEDWARFDAGLFPNPIAAGQTLSLSFDPKFQPTKVAVFSVQGQQVAELSLGYASAGQAQVQLPGHLKPGMYLYKAYDGKEQRMATGTLAIE